MEAQVQQTRTNIAEALRELSEPGAIVPDLSSTMERVESVNTVKFVFHPWIPIDNIGPDGFQFNVHYARFDRLKLIPIPVFDYARIINLNKGFSLMSAIVGDIGAIPGRGQAKIETLMQMPSTSVDALRTAYSKFGFVELESLASADESGLRYSFGLFAQVFREGESDEDLDHGQRPKGLLLENFPTWLNHDAPRLLRNLEQANKTFPIEKAEKLIGELGYSIGLAAEAALSPSTGILPKTKEGLNITANGGTGGKTHLDTLDEWLLKQYPSFEMDTDVERARLAMQTAIEAGNKGQGEITKLLADNLAHQQQSIDLLTQLVVGKLAKPAKASTNETA